MSEHLLENVALELGHKGRIVENSNGRVVALIIMMKTLALTLGHSVLKVYVCRVVIADLYWFYCAVDICI